MFTSNMNKGFSMTFTNGNTISVQWGVANYCEHYMSEMDHKLSQAWDVWKSKDTEMAAWDEQGNWHNFERGCGIGGKQVQGYISADDVLAFMNFVATNKLVTGEDNEQED